MEKLTRIILPEKKIFEGVFIQVYIKGESYIRFEEGNNASCRNLLFKLLKESNISYKVGYMAPLSEGENYKMVGNGKARIAGEEFILSKSSKGGLGPDEKHLEDLAPYLPEGIKLVINNNY